MNSRLHHSPTPRAFELWKIGSFIFPTFWAKIAFKCSTQANFLLKVFIFFGLEHAMGKKSSPSTLNFSTFVQRITWNLTPPFTPLSMPKLIKEKKEHHERHAARDPRHFSCECFFCVNDYVIMKTEIRAARALAWRLLGLVTQHSEKDALRDQSK